MPEIEIGVVVPTLNSAKTLEWTLLALCNQTDCQVQIIVVDSGSTDRTLSICKEYQVRTEYVPPGNMYQAINFGMRLLGTDWLTYLNSDDVVYRDAYGRLVKFGNQCQADVAYGHSDFIDQNGRFLFSYSAATPFLLRGLVYGGPLLFAQPAAIFRKTVYEELGGFRENYKSIADFDFFARALGAGKRFVRLPFPSVAAFRLHPDQFSYKESRIAKEEKRHFLQSGGNRNEPKRLFFLTTWRVLNVKHYLIRFLRTGSLKQR